MTGLVTALLALAGAVLLMGLLVSIVVGRRRSSAARRRPRNAGPTLQDIPRVAVHARQPAQKFALAAPGLRGAIFQYGGDGPGFEIQAPFVIVDIATTGFSAANGDRIVEIALARVDAEGRIHDEYSSIVDPGRDVGPVFLHGISNVEVRDAPPFGDIAGEILDRLDGAVVLAHDAAFVERFLDAEFARIGELLPLSPALCTLWLARRAVPSADHRLPVLARQLGVTAVDTESALGRVRTVAHVLPRLLDAYGEPLRWLCGLRPMPQLECDAAPKARPVEQAATADPWMNALLSRRGLPAAAVEELDAQRYLDAVIRSLAEGRLLGGEAQLLARLAASAGLGAVQLEAVHRRLLEHLKSAALGDAILTTGQIRKLRAAAGALGEPGWFDDLRPTSPQDLVAGRSGPVPSLSVPAVPVPRGVRIPV